MKNPNPGTRPFRAPILFGIALWLGLACGCSFIYRSDDYQPEAPVPPPAAEAPIWGSTMRGPDEPYNVGILVLEGAYNSEVAAPHEVFHHAVYVSDIGTRVFTVGVATDTVLTLEGMEILPYFHLGVAPRIDILVIPGSAALNGLSFGDRRLVRWVAERAEAAEFVIALSDGVGLAAEAGLFDGRECTTHPESVARLRVRYPDVSVVEGVSFVDDGNRISAAGGAAAYEPALYVIERLFGTQAAEEVGRGLLLDWRLDDIACRIAEDEPRADDDPEPSCFLPGEPVNADAALETADGETVRLGDVASTFEGARAIVLCLLGGAEAVDRAKRGGLFCEDTFNDLPMLRHLGLEYEPEGVRFVAVMCPPVYHESTFGYDEGAFLTRGHDDPVYLNNRQRFVEGTLRVIDRDVLPFKRVYYDPRFRLLANPDRGVPSPEIGPTPTWQGRFKWYEDSQTYGTPTIWILRPDLTVYGRPFFMNIYESEGRILRYSARDIAARLDRLLREEQ